MGIVPVLLTKQWKLLKELLNGANQKGECLMILVSVDGADGTGKTTLVNGLIEHYTQQGLKITYLHFPRYNTELGKVIKKVLLKELDMHISAFQMCCSADRLNWSVYEYPKLKEEYDIIIVDRHTSSAIVYGSMDGLEPEEILYNDRRIAQPDINIILYADAETSMKRMSSRNEATTKYENTEAIMKATEKYLKLHELLPNVFYIDATKSIEENRQEAIDIINEQIKYYK
jgi:dTMP kinase